MYIEKASQYFFQEEASLSLIYNNNLIEVPKMPSACSK